MKFRMHSDAEAVAVVQSGIRNAIASRQAVVKIIHGYGSEGIGGSNKVAIHLHLKQLQSDGQIKAYHPGETLSSGLISSLTKRFNGHKQAFTRLQRDCGNEGMTLVLLW